MICAGGGRLKGMVGYRGVYSIITRNSSQVLNYWTIAWGISGGSPSERCQLCEKRFHVMMSSCSLLHYSDVIMTTMASQITSLTVVYSIVYSGADQRKHQSSASLAFVRGIHRTGEFPAQRANNAENLSIWWRHHVTVESKSDIATTIMSLGWGI